MTDPRVHVDRSSRSRWPIPVFTFGRSGRSGSPDLRVHDRPKRAVPFTTIVKSSFGGPVDGRRVVLGAQEYSAWFGGKPPTQPSVDFTKDNVLAVAMGTEPSGGYSVEITSIVQITEGFTAPYCFVHYVEHRPGPHDVVTDVITTPYQVVKCDASGPFVFIAGKSVPRLGRMALGGGGGGQPDPHRGGSGGGGVGNG